MGNQRGFAIVIVMFILLLITLLGIRSTKTSVTELQIATNHLIYQRCFYNAESGVRVSLVTLPSILNNHDQINNPSVDWEANISKKDAPPFYDVTIKHETKDGKVLFYGDTNDDYLLEKNTDGIGYPVEIINSQGTDSRGGRAKVMVGARYELAFPMPKAALWVGSDVNANGVSGSVLGEGPPGDECDDVADILYNNPLAIIEYTGDTGLETRIEQDSKLFPYHLIKNYFGRRAKPLLKAQYSDETFASAENPDVFIAPGNLEIKASDGYGILLVDGDLELKGNFEWHGLIIANGNFRFSGGGHKSIYGAVICMQNAVRLDGGVDIYYDCKALTDLRNRLSSYKMFWWYESS